MNLPRFYNARFLLALPFAIVADLCSAWVARVDAKYAGALGGEDDEGWDPMAGVLDDHDRNVQWPPR